MSSPPAAPLRAMPHSHRYALFVGIAALRWIWAGSFGPSDGELMAWASLDFSAPFPAPFGLMALIAPCVTLLGDSPAGLRAAFSVLSAVPILLVGRHPAAIWLAATLPILTVPGALVSAAAPLAVLWLGALRLAPTRPGWSGALAGVGAAMHPLGALVALPAVATARKKPVVVGAAVLAAAPFLPGSIWSTAQDSTGELSSVGLGLFALGMGGPLVVAGIFTRLTTPGLPRLAAATSVLGGLAVVVWGAPAPVLAGPLAVGLLALAPDNAADTAASELPVPHRVAWPSVGLAAMASVALATVLRFPVAPLPTDPRARFVDTRTLAQTVEAWDIATVYALRPTDIARLRWHGIPATSPPPVHPLDLPDDILLVTPQSADPDLPIHMGWDHARDGPHTVVAHIPSTDPSGSRPVAAWSVSVWQRAPERRAQP